MVSIAHEQNNICSKTPIYRRFFVGHVVDSRPMKRNEKIHRSIIEILFFEVVDRAVFLFSLLFKFPLLEIMSFVNKNEKRREKFYLSFLSGNLLTMENKLREERAKIGHAFIVNNLCFIYIHKKTLNCVFPKPAIKQPK